MAGTAKKDDDTLIPKDNLKDIVVAPGEPGDNGEATADDRPEPRDADRDEDNLDKGVEDSMDGSDVPSAVQP